MLDIKFIRSNPDIVQKAIDLKRKAVKQDIGAILALDAEVQTLNKQWEDLNSQKNRNASGGQGIEAGRAIKEQLQGVQSQLDKVRGILTEKLLKLPNIPSEDTPIGESEKENTVLRKVGEIPTFNFTPLPHEEIGKRLGIIDTETASMVAGSRFNYLKGDGALLEFALTNYAMSVLTNSEILKQIANEAGLDQISTKPFVPVIPPNFIRPEVFQKMARLDPKDDRYYLPDDDLYLIGSAEHTLGSLHMNNTFNTDELPVRYIGYSSCFRREAGTAGKDTRGILRQHQFNKVEMVTFSDPEKSRMEHDFMVAIQEYLMKSLGLPYQVVLLCTGDMGIPNIRHVDIETWLPGQDSYRETHSADFNGDYQSRRLNTKFKSKDGKKGFVHMNDATTFALGRMIIAVLENYQQQDGTVKVPGVLQKFMGKETISRL
ncbi:MAG: serine--tRNA ligase [Candidatus Gracilibacteria bacterium]|nr:serine--tRNA ligase [Candidatus Gracilibacteria bacterium]